jgi:hypothetical protein
MPNNGYMSMSGKSPPRHIAERSAQLGNRKIVSGKNRSRKREVE